MLPPTPQAQPKQEIIVRNPCPDFTIGFSHSTVTDELTARGLSNIKADQFLRYLQQERKLYSDPTLNFLDVRFPILVIEGKSYATRRTVFEAQNQAAVSGSCMVNLQHQLTDLTKSIFPESESGSGSKSSETPLAFTICSERPYIELWVHHSSMEDNLRMHYMNIVKICHGSLKDGLKDFLLDLDSLMSWAGDRFLEDVADQLFKLAEHAARR